MQLHIPETIKRRNKEKRKEARKQRENKKIERKAKKREINCNLTSQKQRRNKEKRQETRKDRPFLQDGTSTEATVQQRQQAYY